MAKSREIVKRERKAVLFYVWSNIADIKGTERRSHFPICLSKSLLLTFNGTYIYIEVKIRFRLNFLKTRLILCLSLGPNLRARRQRK